jgi:hypothetical protein
VCAWRIAHHSRDLVSHCGDELSQSSFYGLLPDHDSRDLRNCRARLTRWLRGSQEICHLLQPEYANLKAAERRTGCGGDQTSERFPTSVEKSTFRSSLRMTEQFSAPSPAYFAC